MTKDEATARSAMKLALEALETERENYQDWDKQDGAPEYIYEAITALREALAEQPAQQEPVAWMWRCKPYCNWPEWSVSLKRPADSGCDGHKRTEGYEDVPLYTTPPQRKPLTDERMWALWNSHGIDDMNQQEAIAFARDIEAAHGIKEKNT